MKKTYTTLAAGGPLLALTAAPGLKGRRADGGAGRYGPTGPSSSSRPRLTRKRPLTCRHIGEIVELEGLWQSKWTPKLAVTAV